ncbi:hypothetical protein ACFQ2B_27905 [Streptomyces stramineus]
MGYGGGGAGGDREHGTAVLRRLRRGWRERADPQGVGHRGKNPRPSHKAQNGERVGLDDVFSNGLRWPGDGRGEAKELANCHCTLDYAKEG